MTTTNTNTPTLTFDAFRAANVARCIKWHPAGIESWSPSDWLTAVTGELGELASLLKMRNRERDGLPGNKFSPTDEQIADELADVLTYIDLLAFVLGVDLGRAAVEKFNRVSERVGFPDRIELPPPNPQRVCVVRLLEVELARFQRIAECFGVGDDETVGNDQLVEAIIDWWKTGRRPEWKVSDDDASESGDE